MHQPFCPFPAAKTCCLPNLTLLYISFCHLVLNVTKNKLRGGSLNGCVCWRGVIYNGLDVAGEGDELELVRGGRQTSFRRQDGLF